VYSLAAPTALELLLREPLLLPLLLLTACENDPLLYCQPDLTPFNVNVVVLTEHPDAPTATSSHVDAVDPTSTWSGLELLRREIDVHLSDNFLDASGGPVCGTEGCVEFDFTNWAFRDDIASTSCTELLAVGDVSDPALFAVDYSNELAAAVSACQDDEVRDPYALNLYIYDDCDWDGAAFDCTTSTGHGRSNLDGDVFKPYVFLDITRLQHQTQAPEEHEFGHALGLAHSCDPAIAVTGDVSNIMQSSCGGAGSGGTRTEGFGDVDHDETHGVHDQIQDLLETSLEIQDAWCEALTGS
jgi:hypothetical protein